MCVRSPRNVHGYGNVNSDAARAAITSNRVARLTLIFSFSDTIVVYVRIVNHLLPRSFNHARQSYAFFYELGRRAYKLYRVNSATVTTSRTAILYYRYWRIRANQLFVHSFTRTHVVPSPPPPPTLPLLPVPSRSPIPYSYNYVAARGNHPFGGARTVLFRIRQTAANERFEKERKKTVIRKAKGKARTNDIVRSAKFSHLRAELFRKRCSPIGYE